MATKIGTNIKIVDKEDKILIVVEKKHKLSDSKSGNSKILASTKRFENVGEIDGFDGKDLGLSLMLTVRDKEKPKKKKPRLDDDDEE